MQTGELRPLGQPEVPQPLGRKLLITLVPLRSDGPRCLDIADLPGFRKITLVELELLSDSLLHEVMVIRADDIFQSASASDQDHQPTLRKGEITRAVFRIEFSDTHFILLEILESETITCPPETDFVLVEGWLVHSHLASQPDWTRAFAA